MQLTRLVDANGFWEDEEKHKEAEISHEKHIGVLRE